VTAQSKPVLRENLKDDRPTCSKNVAHGVLTVYNVHADFLGGSMARGPQTTIVISLSKLKRTWLDLNLTKHKTNSFWRTDRWANRASPLVIGWRAYVPTVTQATDAIGRYLL